MGFLGETTSQSLRESSPNSLRLAALGTFLKREA